MAIVTDISCNLQKAVKAQYLDGNLFSQDVYGNIIRVTVMDGEEPATLTGTVSGTAIRADGGTVALTDGSLEGNVVSVSLPAAAYYVPGVIAITVKLSDENTVTTLAQVISNVYRTSTDTPVDPGTIIPSITALITEIETAVATIPADYSSLWTSLAPAFSPSKGYKIGEYVTYDGGLYRFKNAHTGSWSASDVDAVDLGAGISAISEETRNLWTYSDLSGTKAVNKSFNFVSGKKYTISCKITSNYSGSNQNSRISLTDNDTHEKAMGVIVHDGTRHSCTITAVDDCTKIYFYAANTSSNSNGYTVSVSDIQIEEGETMTAYVPHISATDFDARNNVAENKAEINKIVEAGVNLWTYGDLSGTKFAYKNYNFTEGKTYTISCKITSSDTENNYSRISIMDSSAHEVLHDIMKHDGERHSVTMTAIADCKRLYFYASNTSGNSENKTLSVTDIQVEEGSTATPFMPENVTAIDYIARGEIEKYKETESNLLFVSDKTYESSENNQTITFISSLYDSSFGDPVVFCDATFTRISGVTDYPRCRIAINNNRNLQRYSTWYKVGSEGEYRYTEWRSPAYIWEERVASIVIVIPAGCTLTIRKLGIRCDTNIDRTNARGVTFFARPGTCNFVPELSAPALQMAYRHGYDAFTVIPKVSSDGQWFAYHDDTWVETGADKTTFVNSDGSAITEDQYNNKYFHEIPFTYLDQFRAGSYGSMFMTRFLKLEDCCEFLAKTGMKLRFSMHPSRGISRDNNGNRYENDYKLVSLRKLVQKYGLLKDLSIIVNDIDALFAVFGNDIGCYCFPNANGSSWESGAAKPVNSGFVAAQAAKTTYGINVPINCGLWEDALFENKVAAENLVSDILDSGFTAGGFNDTITGIDGSEHNYCWSEDLRWLMSIGITEFTEGYNTSVGLNW